PLVQYLSFPMYSHYRKGRGLTPPWLPRYPVFVGGTPEGRPDVLARYALLYHALTSGLIDFSFTGFAGSDSWGLQEPPQYVLVDLEVAPNCESPSAKLTTRGTILFHLEASLPPPKFLPLQTTSPSESLPIDGQDAADRFA